MNPIQEVAYGSLLLIAIAVYIVYRVHANYYRPPGPMERLVAAAVTLMDDYMILPMHSYADTEVRLLQHQANIRRYNEIAEELPIALRPHAEQMALEAAQTAIEEGRMKRWGKQVEQVAVSGKHAAASFGDMAEASRGFARRKKRT